MGADYSVFASGGNTLPYYIGKSNAKTPAPVIRSDIPIPSNKK
jgi:hypothetical protein